MRLLVTNAKPLVTLMTWMCSKFTLRYTDTWWNTNHCVCSVESRASGELLHSCGTTYILPLHSSCLATRRPAEVNMLSLSLGCSSEALAVTSLLCFQKRLNTIVLILSRELWWREREREKKAGCLDGCLTFIMPLWWCKAVGNIQMAALN